VVCLRYLDPEYIDPKLFDSREVFQDTETDNTHKHFLTTEINSLSKLMQQRRWRQGYDDTTTGNLHKKVNIEEFLKMENPFPVFAIYNEFSYDEKFKEEVENYGKTPDDWEEMFKDLKVLGKREIATLIKWKRRINLERRKKIVINCFHYI
jgi:AdoMet-dependent rRNA methyltransferase SPB1